TAITTIPPSPGRGRSPARGAHVSRIVRCLTVMALAGALLVVDGWSVAPAGEAQVGPEHPGDVVELLAVSTTPDRRFVDSAGREVLLRGANVNSLAEYWQGVP